MVTRVETRDEVVRADHVPGPPQGSWTYEDYARIPDDGNRYEVIGGVLYMTPAPNLDHQRSVGAILYYLYGTVKVGGRGSVFPAPTDVTLQDGSTMHPDVVVVLNEHADRIANRKRVIGPPDLVVEIASPSTTIYDETVKKPVYAQAGVPELWMVDPVGRTVDLLVLDDGEFRSLGVFSGSDRLPSRIVPDLDVPVERFFP